MRFASRHTLWLEKELEKQEQRHSEEIARLENSHAEQLKYAIEENERLREELTRTRYLLTPALQNVSLKPDDAPPPALSDEDVGTPWQRIVKHSIKAQKEQDSIAHRVASEAAAKAATEEKPA
jgi:hypothetical protein